MGYSGTSWDVQHMETVYGPRVPGSRCPMEYPETSQNIPTACEGTVKSQSPRSKMSYGTSWKILRCPTYGSTVRFQSPRSKMSHGQSWGISGCPTYGNSVRSQSPRSNMSHGILPGHPRHPHSGGSVKSQSPRSKMVWDILLHPPLHVQTVKVLCMSHMYNTKNKKVLLCTFLVILV